MADEQEQLANASELQFVQEHRFARLPKDHAIAGANAMAGAHMIAVVMARQPKGCAITMVRANTMVSVVVQQPMDHATADRNRSGCSDAIICYRGHEKP